METALGKAFDEIGFKPSGNVVYQYAVTVSADGKSFIATATGDVNEDGIKTTYKFDSKDRDSKAMHLTLETEGE